MAQQGYETNLNFTPGGNPLLGAMTGVGGLAGQYALSYQSALQANQTNYNNIVGNYQKLLQNVDESLSQASIQPDLDLIDRDYTARAGSAMQNSIDRGLGQTTAATAAQRGASFDAGLTKAKLLSDLERQKAGFRANIGQSLLGFQERVQAPYPDANAYNQLYGNLLGFQQAQQARADQQAAAAIGRVSAGGGGGVNVIGAGGGRGVPATNTGGGQRGFSTPGLTTSGLGNSIGGSVGYSSGGYTPYGNTGVSYANTNPLGGYTPSPYAGSGDLYGGIASASGGIFGGMASALGNIGSTLGDYYGNLFGGASVEDEY